MIADTIIIFDFSIGFDRLAHVLENLWHFPPPMFDVAIDERYTATLVMTVRREVEPKAIPRISGNRDAKQRVEYPAFVHVNEYKKI